MIPTMGSIQDLMANYNAKEWAQTSKIEFNDQKFVKNLKENANLKSGGTFGEMLAKSVNQVNELQKDANQAIEKLATGKSQSLHETMLMVEQAEIAFKTMNQVRQKVLDAYKEIMKMQI